jgi:hypothetical protein
LLILSARLATGLASVTADGSPSDMRRTFLMTKKTPTRAKPATAKRAATSTRAPTKKAAPQPAATKAEMIIGLLRRADGATATDLAKATGWQQHSVRGFLSGDLKKKRGLAVTTEKVDGVTRYRLAKAS